MSRVFKIITLNIFTTLVIFEACSATFLRNRIQKIFSEYLQNTNIHNGKIGRGYPKGYFSAHKERGFDIEKNSPPRIKSLPKAAPYLVYGNNIGCFDETPISKKRYYVYLAGDSFTWGYTRIEKKFGTLLENKLQRPVAACGVTNTGQMHQFSKFKDISQQLGYFPKYVIVNVYLNDIGNDFLYPMTTVIDGFQVNYSITKWEGNLPVRVEIPFEELQKTYNKLLTRKRLNRFGDLDPRKYLASAALFGEFLKLFVFPVKVDESVSYPIKTEFAKKNRNTIIQWINDSKKHNYNLIFADLQTQKLKHQLSIGSQEIDQSFCEFIKKEGANCYSFMKFLSINKPETSMKSISWKTNGHFNHKGNKYYAEFLLQILKRYK